MPLIRRHALVLAVAFLSSCGGTSSAIPTPTPSPPSNTCTVTGYASLSWSLPQPASNPAPPIQSATVSGDTLKLNFFSGTPNFVVTLQPTAHFNQDPSGNPVNLSGSAGAVLVVSGFRGFQPNYTGPKTLTSTGPLLLQVTELGDFEGYVTWGVGLSAPGCANVTKNGSTLVVHFVKTS